MTTAVDSSVILDVLVGASPNRSLDALRCASLEGRLIVCEAVLAEIRPAFESDVTFCEFLSAWGLEFEAGTLETAKLAGEL